MEVVSTCSPQLGCEDYATGWAAWNAARHTESLAEQGTAGPVQQPDRSRGKSGPQQPYPFIEPCAILADRHGQRHQFLKRLLGVRETHHDGANGQFDAFRKAFQIVALKASDLGVGHFDEHRRSFDPPAASLGEMSPEPLPPLPLEVSILPRGNSFQMGDQLGAVGYQAGPHALGNGSQQLLGAPAADREQRLEGSPVDPWLIVLFKLTDSLGQAVEPQRLIGHA